MTKKFYITMVSFVLTAVFMNIGLKADETPQVRIGAYVDTYIATDNDNMSMNEYSTTYRQYAHLNGKKGEFGINVAQLSAAIDYKDFIRGRATIHTGDMPIQVYNFQALQEAYIGIQAMQGLWIDAGYFINDISSEKLLPKDNWLSSHSLLKSNAEPFFHSGIRGMYNTGQFTFGLMILNGYGIINDNNDNKSLGFIIIFKPNSNTEIGYNGYYGNEAGRNNPARILFYNNINAFIALTQEFHLKAQLDAIMTETPDFTSQGKMKSITFIGLSAQARYFWSKLFKTTFRAALGFNDDMAIPGVSKSFMDLTLGQEYSPTSFSFIRLEGRMIQLDEATGKFFHDSEKATNSRMELILNFGVFVN